MSKSIFEILDRQSSIEDDVSYNLYQSYIEERISSMTHIPESVQKTVSEKLTSAVKDEWSQIQNKNEKAHKTAIASSIEVILDFIESSAIMGDSTEILKKVRERGPISEKTIEEYIDNQFEQKVYGYTLDKN